MAKYDDLIQKLRNLAKVYSICTSENTTEYRLAVEAADAIEELSKRIDRAVELYNRSVEKSAMYEALVGIAPEPPKEEA